MFLKMFKSHYGSPSCWTDWKAFKEGFEENIPSKNLVLVDVDCSNSQFSKFFYKVEDKNYKMKEIKTFDTIYEQIIDALKFYEKPEHYVEINKVPSKESDYVLYLDGGSKARTCLEEIEKIKQKEK